jgi:replicative DNA helicase
VLVFSLEMSKEQVAQRLLCSEAALPSQKLRNGFLNEEEWRRLSSALGRLGEAKIFIDDTPVHISYGSKDQVPPAAG